MDHYIIEINEENLDNYPQVVCFTNVKHPYHYIKMDWIRSQFEKGLKIKLLFLPEFKRPVGFIEYIPGENCWRAIAAEGYMFIHCLWTNGRKHQHQGLGSILLGEVEKDAANMNGVSVLTSDKAFMANRSIFLKNNYKLIQEEGKEQLLVKQYTNSKLPKILDNKRHLSKIQDLTIIYSDQCPWVSRFRQDIEPLLKKRKLTINIIRINSAKEAQQAPSVYSVFNLIYQGRILADRYISVTRLKNILNQEVIL